MQKTTRLGIAAGGALAAALAFAPTVSAAASTTPTTTASSNTTATTATTATAKTAPPAATTATAKTAPTAASADCECGHKAHDAVFVQTDNPLGNQIVAYRRAADGTLSWAGVYNTRGLGGVLTGSVVDHLSSQGALTYDPRHSLLYAVNAGSNTVSAFSVDGDRLSLRQVVQSGGRFPVSIAVHDDVVYVLNALDGGSVQGYRVSDRRLSAVPAWHRGLGLDPNATPQFTHTPAQVGFTGDHTQLVVTTKANGNAVVVFPLDGNGGLAGAPVVNPEPGTAPFGFVAADARNLLVTQSTPNTVATILIGHDGSATVKGASGTGQSATCWIARAGDFVYASNAGSNSLSGFRIGAGGLLTALTTTATDPGTIDAAATADHRYLYVQTGADGIVDEFKINPSGSLTAIGTQPVPNAAGGEGIVAF